MSLATTFYPHIKSNVQIQTLNNGNTIEIRPTSSKILILRREKDLKVSTINPNVLPIQKKGSRILNTYNSLTSLQSQSQQQQKSLSMDLKPVLSQASSVKDIHKQTLQIVPLKPPSQEDKSMPKPKQKLLSQSTALLEQMHRNQKQQPNKLTSQLQKCYTRNLRNYSKHQSQSEHEEYFGFTQSEVQQIQKMTEELNHHIQENNDESLEQICLQSKMQQQEEMTPIQRKGSTLVAAPSSGEFHNFIRCRKKRQSNSLTLKSQVVPHEQGKSEKKQNVP